MSETNAPRNESLPFMDALEEISKENSMANLMQEINHENAEEHKHNEVDEVDLFDQEYKPIEDIYAMLAVFPLRDKAFVYACLIFFAQMLILLLFIIDQLSEATLVNPLSLPVMTKPVVIFGQVFALYVTVMTASDVTQSLDVFYVIYDHDIEKHFPCASKGRWYLANFLRGIEGTISIVVAFVFIVQSTSNLDLFQNFAAVEFVSELDNLGFYLAHQGHTVSALTSRTRLIKEHFVFKKQPKEREIKKIQKRAMRLLVFILLVVYFITLYLRTSGHIFDQKCQSFVVLLDTLSYNYFGSCERCPDAWKVRQGRDIVYPNFNGIYSVKRRAGGRIDLFSTGTGYPTYIQSGEANETLVSNVTNPEEPRGQFLYCPEVTAWVFVIEGVKKQEEFEDATCDWLMKSPETKERDFNLVPKEGWVVWTGRVQQSENLKIFCAECEPPFVSDEEFNDNDFKLSGSNTNTFCNYHGVCSRESNSCMCKKKSGWMGVQCQICADCESYVLTNPSDMNFTEEYYYRIDGNENLPLEVHSRPAFYRGMDSTTAVPNPDMIVLLHTGNRYAFWNISNQLNTSNPLREQIILILSNFHSQWSLTGETVPLRSVPTKRTTPFNLTWIKGEEEGQSGIELIFSCTSLQHGCSFID